MASVEEKIRDALYAQAEAMTLDGEPPLAWPNDPDFEPPAGGPYINVSLFPNRNIRFLMRGGDPHLRQGIFQLTVVAPLNATEELADALAGAIAEFFPADLALFEEDVKVRIQAAPDVLRGQRTDAAWEVPVSIRYEALV